MNKLEKEIKKVEDNSDITKWQAVWGITKAVGQLGLYAGLIGVGYYGGYQIKGHETGLCGAIAAGVCIARMQDNDTSDDGYMEI